VSSGLLLDAVTESRVFKAAESACNLKKGLFPQDAASALFHVHLSFVQAFYQGIFSFNFSGYLSDPLTFEERHQQIINKAVQAVEPCNKKKGKGRN